MVSLKLSFSLFLTSIYLSYQLPFILLNITNKRVIYVNIYIGSSIVLISYEWQPYKIWQTTALAGYTSSRWLSSESRELSWDWVLSPGGLSSKHNTRYNYIYYKFLAPSNDVQSNISIRHNDVLNVFIFIFFKFILFWDFLP